MLCHINWSLQPFPTLKVRHPAMKLERWLYSCAAAQKPQQYEPAWVWLTWWLHQTSQGNLIMVDAQILILVLNLECQFKGPTVNLILIGSCCLQMECSDHPSFSFNSCTFAQIVANPNNEEPYRKLLCGGRGRQIQYQERPTPSQTYRDTPVGCTRPDSFSCRRY